MEPHSEQLENLEDTNRNLMDFSKQSSINTESVHKLPQLKLKVVGESCEGLIKPHQRQDEDSPTSFSMKLNNKNMSPSRKPQHRYLDPTYSSSSRNY